MIMKKNPVTTVSTSVHVMFWNPICPSIGESKAGKIMMKIPCAIHPIIVPRRPPTWLAKIPAVPPAKKLLITPGKIIGNPSIGVKNIPMIDPIVRLVHMGIILGSLRLVLNLEPVS